jgi:hypothetical protein
MLKNRFFVRAILLLLNNNVLLEQTSNYYKVLESDSGYFQIRVKNAVTTCISNSEIVNVKLHKIIKPIIREKKEQGVLTILIVDNTLNTYSNYLWINTNPSSLGAEIENNRQFLILKGSEIEGQFMVHVTDINGCQFFSDQKYVSNSIMASTEVYPTVNRGRFHINLVHPYVGKVAVRIYNESGSSIKQLNFEKITTKSLFNIEMSTLSAGKYLIEVSMDTYKSSQWIIVE